MFNKNVHDGKNSVYLVKEEEKTLISFGEKKTVDTYYVSLHPDDYKPIIMNVMENSEDTYGMFLRIKDYYKLKWMNGWKAVKAQTQTNNEDGGIERWQSIAKRNRKEMNSTAQYGQSQMRLIKLSQKSRWTHEKREKRSQYDTFFSGRVSYFYYSYR